MPVIVQLNETAAVVGRCGTSELGFVYHNNEQQVSLCVEMGACHRVRNGDKFLLASETAPSGDIACAI